MDKISKYGYIFLLKLPLKVGMGFAASATPAVQTKSEYHNPLPTPGCIIIQKHNR